MMPPDWSWPDAAARLEPGTVHVWSVNLRDCLEPAAEFKHWLDPDECARSERLVRPLDRDRFLTRRVMLRLILATYLDADPATLRYQFGPWGKPELLPSRQHDPLHFNASHSHGLALYAVSQSGPIGVDIEKIAPVPELASLTEHCFTQDEQSQLRHLAGDRQLEAFYRSWTCKEAVLKAVGEGIGQGLDRVEVRLNPEGMPTTGVIARESTRETWTLSQLHPEPGYFGAVSYRAGSACRIGRILAGFPAARLLAGTSR
jgi:4'-phosphopantetheinyl transferase